MPSPAWDHSVDVLVVGSGLGGMTAALSAYEMGCKDVLLVEKAGKFGGTSALSGGVIWIPCNKLAREAGQQDSLEEAHTYLRNTIPDAIRRDDMLGTYLAHGPKMIDFLYEKSHARYTSLSMYPDYHTHIAGSKEGNRALESEPFDSSLLGADNDIVSHSHPIWYLFGIIPLTLTEANTISVKLKGWKLLLTKLLAKYAFDLPWRLRSRYDRKRKIGGSHVARLYLSLKERGISMWRSAPLQELIEENGRVIGAVIQRDGKACRVKARRGVILTAGGFEHNQSMREQYLPHPTNARWSAGVKTNTGDAITAGARLGAATEQMQKGWWCMTCSVPGEAMPRLMIMEKSVPGTCLVNRNGKRFLNESENYVTMQDKLYAAHTNETPCAPAYLIFDARVRRKYIIGPLLTARTRPDWMLPKRWFSEGMITKADSLVELAKKTGINPHHLEETVAQINRYAVTGKGLDFGRGDSSYDRHYGDPEIKPNPNLAPIIQAPFYAFRLEPGDIGTMGGLVTNMHGQVLRENGEPLEGLYASGNCTSAILPTYPGPGATLGPAMVFAYQAAKHITGYRD
ncbi:FAD-dependent oxidoreductase [Noviherbaspirillum sedimenti]|uniref:3-oxosteroid 1-dehydrogenase n=2 Tax=Noviherbaspirillum sedimenti TaxID=2320865 RepID=A0A3A3G9E9_9BURK|nr:FAD-dependent oxidoreductase [Noviherbaspirillum sedimenti]RJG03202.1 FAD-dependent oxidoreductase [Noviherbaspirillum sedimenti]